MFKLKVLWFLYISVNISLQYSYKASVVEFAVEPSTSKITERIEKNIKNYFELIQSASKQNVDIMVFPESTLNNGHSIDREINLKHAVHVPDAKYSITPCNDDSYHKILKQFSCLAKSSKMYLVINLSEKEKCTDIACSSDLHNLYNTNVVFDRKGRIISKYRKIHLLDEKSLNSSKIELSTFTTDFNITFGHMIGFDVIFSQPLSEYLSENIRHFVLPMRWHSKMPFLTAVQLQNSMAYVHDINILAAGTNRPRHGSSGSGIYRGRSGAKTMLVSGDLATYILTMTIDDKNQNKITQSYASEKSVNSKKIKMLNENLEGYKWKTIDMSRDVNHINICYNEFCCDITSKTSNIEDGGSIHYTYIAVAFDGTRNLFNHIPVGVQTCGIVACTGENINTCGTKFNDTLNSSKSVIFESIIIEGKFNRNNTIQLPISLQENYLPISDEKYKFKIKESSSDSKHVQVEFSTSFSEANILTFAIFGRDFNKDVLQHLKQCKECEETKYEKCKVKLLNLYKKVMEELYDIIYYILEKLKIISIILILYFLEMM